ncbi:MAG: PAS domain S-box protein [Rubrobacteraceae bacterium]
MRTLFSRPEGIANEDAKREDEESCLLVATKDGEILDANAAARRLLGRSRQEMVSAGRNEIFWASRLREVVEEWRRERGFRGEMRLSRGDGTTFAADVRAVALGEDKVGIVFRKVGEEPSSKSFFKAFVENRSGAVILAAKDGGIRYASPFVGELLGHEPEEMIGGRLSECLHPEDRFRLADVLGENGPTRRTGRFRLRRGGGGWVELEGSVENLLDDPEINGVVLVGWETGPPEDEPLGFEDKLKGVVARLEESERRLRESEKLFRTTFDEAPVGIAHVGTDGRWIRVNKKLCEILGHPRKGLLGNKFQDMTHSDDLESDLKTMELMLAGDISSISHEKRFVKGDFAHVWVSVSASLARDGDGDPRYFICAIEDVTESKRAQLVVQSLRAREIEVLKLLSHGLTNPQIAREMNFSLSSAKVHVGNVIRKLEAKDRTHAAVKAASLGILGGD